MTQASCDVSDDPVDDQIAEVLVRIQQTSVFVYQPDFYEYVAAKAGSEKETPLTPSFCTSWLATKYLAMPSADSCELLHLMLAELELGLTFCIWARSAQGSRQMELLKRASVHCMRFDELREAERRAALLDARRRGGKARHAVNDCARLRAARLIFVMSPATGWKSPAQAARVIESRLARFIGARRLSIVCEDSFRRTIVRWIHNHPAVRAAFLATRTAAE